MTRSRTWMIVAVLAVALVAVLVAVLVTRPDRTGVVVPGAPMTDTDGEILQARGAGVFQVGSTYYLVGEDRTAGPTYTAVACYSSENLVDWTREDDALGLEPSGDLAAGRVVERPKVIHNDSTDTFVMYLHIDDAEYEDARVGVATSDTPCGPYDYRGSFRPLEAQSRDMGLFEDTDGSAYLIAEDRASGLRIGALSDDYLSVVDEVTTIETEEHLESPALVRHGDTYFLFASNRTGWDTNDNVYATATSLEGPWSDFSPFAPVGTDTYDSQTSFVLPVTGSTTSGYLYLGDRWMADDLNRSLPVWLPLDLDGTTASMPYAESWSVDTGTGVMTSLSTDVVASDSGRCLDLVGDDGAEVSDSELWDCIPWPDQQWTHTDARTLRASGDRCLTAGTAEDEAGVGSTPCDGSAEQAWTFGDDGTLRSDSTGLCAEVDGDGGNGSRVTLAACAGGAAQQWKRG
jgi:hypothetical protein